MHKSNLLLAALALLSIQSVRAGDSVSTHDYKDKMISPTEPAAKRGGLYIGIFGGANLSQSSDSKQINVSDARPRTYGTAAQIAAYQKMPGNDIPANANPIPNGTSLTSPTFSTNMQSNTGWLAGLKVGYVIPTHTVFLPAVELEAFYNGMDTVGSARSNKTIKGLRADDNESDEVTEPFKNPDAGIGPTKASANFHDSLNSAVFMINGIVNLDLGRVRPYIGGGVGFAYVTHSYTKTTITADSDGGRPVQLLPKSHSTSDVLNAPDAQFSFGSDNEVTFAWQGIAGIDFLLTQHISIFAEYKALFYLQGPYYRNLFSNTVSGGIKYNF